MHLIFLIPTSRWGKEQPEPKCFLSQHFPCKETKKIEEKEKRNRIIELQRNEMFEQKIISLACSLEA